MNDSPPIRPRWTAIRGTLVGLGAVMALAALFARQLGLDASPGIGKGEALLFLVGVLVAAAGVLGRRLVSAYRITTVVVFNTLVLLLGLELGATALSTLRHRRAVPNDWPVNYPELPYYRHTDWGATYWTEMFESGVVHYQPYVLWRRPPYRGETIRIDRDGRRETPGAVCTDDALQVFVFGGSAMWGYGSPDEGTIAAYLQAGLQATSAQPVCVTNFGEISYVSTQELLTLLLQLQAGHVPDVVVFFDGVNDVYAAYQSGRAGGHQNEQQIAARFERRKTTLRDVLDELALVRLIRSLGPGAVPATYATRGLDADSLAEAVAQTYVRTAKLVDALGAAYGFRSYFFWQPYLTVGEKPLTENEQEFAEVLDPALVRLYALAYRRMEVAADSIGALHDLADVLDGEPEFRWIDNEGHVTPEANRLIAEAMLRIIRE